MLSSSQAARSGSVSVTTISALLLLLAANAVPVTLRNDVPRVDNTGNIISAGDGCISYHPDEQLYYLFGAHYQPCHEPNTDCYAGADGLKPCQTHEKVDAGLCCGWRNATIAAWSSPDLSAWTLEGLNILPVLTSNSSVYSSEYMAIFEPCGGSIERRASGAYSFSATATFSRVQLHARLPVHSTSCSGMCPYLAWIASSTSTSGKTRPRVTLS